MTGAARTTGWLLRRPWLLGALAAAGVTIVALLALRQLTADLRLHDLRVAWHALPPWRIAAALGCTIASYLCLTLYDVIALAVIGRPLPWRTAALASFTSYTLSHNLGLAVLTGGSVRLRVYTGAGLEPADVARVIASAGIAFWAGVAAVAGIALLVDPQPLPLPGHMLSPLVQALAGGVVLLTGGMLLLLGPRTIGFGPWRLPLPGRRQAAVQVAVAAADLALASAALFVLVPGVGAGTYPAFFLGYALAIVVALLSHVPGGLGVFEAVMLAALPGDRTALFAALVGYRVIYYLLPLALATLLLLVHEWRAWRRPLARTVQGAQAIAAGISPPLLATLAFAGGTVLLVSGSLPALPARLRLLHGFVPLPFIEASHIAASLVGTLLLVLAPGLYRRLDGAFVATRALLVAGAGFSLAKGLDYEEAAVLLGVAALLEWTRPAFYRRTALTAQPLTPGWLGAVAAAIGLSLWIGFFAYKHVDYQNDLWWQFALSADASRFLRASLGVAVLLAGVLLWRLFGPGEHRGPDVLTDAVAARALARTDRTDALLAFTGDKSFVVSEAGDAFLMYRVEGRSWIVMGDPVGAQEAWAELLWAIRAKADAAQGRLLLYQITAAALPIAIELGLSLVKYGEEARVDLAAFSLAGPRAKNLRNTSRRAEREGATLAIVPPADQPAILAELRAVSDAWLAAKARGEKRFSLGRFDPAYLARSDIAVVRAGGRIVAFANIWATPNRHELSVDLMRHADALPYGTMDFLFAQLMLWGRAQGYRWFSLGLAPLSGLEAHRLAPLWTKIASFLFRHGERSYGFEGLRAYKEKFAPVWAPRYIAGPRGLPLMRALVDLQALIGGKDGAGGRAPPPKAGGVAIMLRRTSLAWLPGMMGTRQPRMSR